MNGEKKLIIFLEGIISNFNNRTALFLSISFAIAEFVVLVLYLIA